MQDANDNNNIQNVSVNPCQAQKPQIEQVPKMTESTTSYAEVPPTQQQQSTPYSNQEAIGAQAQYQQAYQQNTGYVYVQEQQSQHPGAMDIFRKGYQDLRKEDKGIRSLMFKALIALVPVLNFFAYGAAAYWMRDVIAGSNSEASLPRKIFKTRYFVSGAVVALFSALFSWISILILCIPIIGFLYIVGVVFVMPIFYLFISRWSVYGRLGEAFKIGDTAEGLKQGYWSLLLATFLPGLIVGVIVFLLSFIVVYGIIYLSVLPALFGAFALTALVASLLCFGLIFVSIAISMFITFWIFRSVGFWAHIYIPHWRDIADATQNRENAEDAIKQAAVNMQNGDCATQAQSPYGYDSFAQTVPQNVVVPEQPYQPFPVQTPEQASTTHQEPFVPQDQNGQNRIPDTR